MADLLPQVEQPQAVGKNKAFSRLVRGSADGRRAFLLAAAFKFCNLAATQFMTTATNEQTPRQNDAALVDRLKARDKSALEDLLRLHGSKLYGVALQITRNENDANDVMQDALITIWNKIGTFEHRSSFSTWLYRVTANAALMRLRKNKKFEQNVPLENDGPDHDLPVIQLADPRETPDAEAQRDELGVQVRTAIDKLDEPYRTTVLLADVDELSMEEIAATMDVTVPAVKSRLHRARLALRKALEPYLKGTPQE